MKNFAFLFVPLFVACSQNSTHLNAIADLPKSIKESSACEVIGDTIWTLEDKGNDAVLYALNSKGELLHRLNISDAKNNDWEDLTSDSQGNLYIGDFGNNDNDRKNLAIYKISANQLKSDSAVVSLITEFSYPEQTEFPPKKSKLFFDCEAFFEHNGYFYLFTKNRSAKFDGTTTLYKVPVKAGIQKAVKISDYQTCDKFKSCAITSADISPDGKKVVLLTNNKAFILSDFSSDDFFSGKKEMISLDYDSQKEGIGFKNNEIIYITDEAEKSGNSKLFELNLSKSKSDTDK